MKNILSLTLGFFQLFNPSASWLLLVEMNTDDNPEVSLEDSIWSYPGFSRPYLFFSSFFFFFAMPGMEPRALHMPGKLSTTEPKLQCISLPLPQPWF